jgi:hypothetical protein
MTKLENFRLQYLDVEYELVNIFGRELTEKESNYLFLNYLRRNMNLSFSFENNPNPLPVLTKSIQTKKRVNDHTGEILCK